MKDAGKDFLTSLHSHMNTHKHKHTLKMHTRLIAIMSMYSRLKAFLSIV